MRILDQIKAHGTQSEWFLDALGIVVFILVTIEALILL